MRNGVLVIAGLVCAQPLYGQTASADSAAIVALELEMSRLLAVGQVDEYATHLTSDYARTTRQEALERRDARAGGRVGRVVSCSLPGSGYGCTAMPPS